MSDLEKINIYVPEHIGALLDNDASMFEIYKRDRQTINRNRFLSMLILGYNNAYVAECQQAYDAIVSELINHGLKPDKYHDIANSIVRKVFLPYVPLRKGKKPSKLSLKPTKDTEGLILSIMNELGDGEFISQYLCRMLTSYCEKPFSDREQIVFRDNFEKLKNACKHNKPITFSTIWNAKVVHTVIPYKLTVGYEGLYNYLLCAEVNKTTGIQETRTYRLNRISKINYSRTDNHFSEEVLQHLEQMVRNGPQFMINDDEESCVRLTDLGKIHFSRIYYGRPYVDRIEEREDGHYYYFKGSKDQVFFYFRRFGNDDAEIISPEYLRKKMADFHLKAYENYK